MEPLHVLVIPSWYPTAENEISGSFFKEQSEALLDLGMKVGVIYPEIRPISNFSLKGFWVNHFQIRTYEENGINVIRMHGWNKFPKLPEREGRYWITQALKLFDIYVEKFGMPDIIHAHSALWGGYAACLISQKYDIPYVVTEHSSAFVLRNIEEWRAAYAVKAFEGAAAVLAVSKFFADSLKHYTDRVIGVIPNMVDTGLFHPAEGDRAQASEGFQFCSVAGLNKNKGMDLVIRAFAQAFEHQPHIKLAVGGKGPELQNLKDLIAEKHLEHRVTLLGPLSRSEVSRLMQESQCFVLASQYETFGVVVIEALASGLPVVSTRCGGPEEVVKEGLGLLVEKDDAGALARGMKIIYDNYRTYDRAYIRAYAANNYGRDMVVKKLENVYREVLKDR
ncbi:glycosyltransferase family 4 protein [Clostridium thermarum]|uniref:glycosyltransferase family 4 protein n=1 Tax=Clostridium thermarum TaxID=1716543 RepID=UPI0013D61648|nr:glycosyltransferase family 4 protein [Clostridium thermarum]